MIMTLRLRRAGVSTPKTHFAFSAEAAENIMKDAGYPLVIKPVVGSWGRGVIPIRGPDTLAAVLEARSVTDGPFDRIFYLQEVIRRSEGCGRPDARHTGHYGGRRAGIGHVQDVGGRGL